MAKEEEEVTEKKVFFLAENQHCNHKLFLGGVSLPFLGGRRGRLQVIQTGSDAKMSGK